MASVLNRKNTKARAIFVKNVSLFGRFVSCYIWHKIPRVKRGGGSMTVWGCFVCLGPGGLAVTDEKKKHLESTNLTLEVIVLYFLTLLLSFSFPSSF